MEYECVTLEIDDGIAILTLNRPKVLNSLNLQLIEEGRKAFAEVKNNPDDRVLIITGSGRAFCAGADLGAAGVGNAGPNVTLGDMVYRNMHEAFNPFMTDLYNLPVPTVSAINGVAAGGGVSLALLPDITIAARSAKFIVVFTRQLGLLPDMGATWELPRLVGRARALGLALLGERLSAEKAEDWGLIWKCVDDDALLDEALDVAQRLKEGPTLAYPAVRRALDRAVRHEFEGQLNHERDIQQVLANTEDFTEGVTAFLQKRKPVFKGK